jgi:hypothetical protein
VSISVARSRSSGEKLIRDEEKTMKYALLIYGDPAAAGPNAPVPPGAIADWVDYTRALKDSGALVAVERLHATDTATTVRHRGERIVTDGPFAETKEHLLGFFLIQADDLDAALEWAGRMPSIGYGSVEVRAAMTGLPWQALLGD